MGCYEFFDCFSSGKNCRAKGSKRKEAETDSQKPDEKHHQKKRAQRYKKLSVWGLLATEPQNCIWLHIVNQQSEAERNIK